MTGKLATSGGRLVAKAGQLGCGCCGTSIRCCRIGDCCLSTDAVLSVSWSTGTWTDMNTYEPVTPPGIFQSGSVTLTPNPDSCSWVATIVSEGIEYAVLLGGGENGFVLNINGPDRYLWINFRPTTCSDGTGVVLSAGGYLSVTTYDDGEGNIHAYPNDAEVGDPGASVVISGNKCCRCGKNATTPCSPKVAFDPESTECFSHECTLTCCSVGHCRYVLPSAFWRINASITIAGTVLSKTIDLFKVPGFGGHYNCCYFDSASWVGNAADASDGGGAYGSGWLWQITWYAVPLGFNGFNNNRHCTVWEYPTRTQLLVGDWYQPPGSPSDIRYRFSVDNAAVANNACHGFTVTDASNIKVDTYGVVDGNFILVAEQVPVDAVNITATLMNNDLPSANCCFDDCSECPETILLWLGPLGQPNYHPSPTTIAQKVANNGAVLLTKQSDCSYVGTISIDGSPVQIRSFRVLSPQGCLLYYDWEVGTYAKPVADPTASGSLPGYYWMKFNPKHPCPKWWLFNVYQEGDPNQIIFVDGSSVFIEVSDEGI
jgi:hypothetical protein